MNAAKTYGDPDLLIVAHLAAQGTCYFSATRSKPGSMQTGCWRSIAKRGMRTWWVC
jgi:hypothetical protein